MDIFPSREVDTGLVNSNQLVKAINKKHVSYLASEQQVLEKIKEELDKNQILFFLGAGETDKLAKKLLAEK
jgi:UDP-N-acetylmuramate-alanine ligase